MSNFKVRFETERVKDWEEHYLDYAGLEGALEEAARSRRVVSPSIQPVRHGAEIQELEIDDLSVNASKRHSSVWEKARQALLVRPAASRTIKGKISTLLFPSEHEEILEFLELLKGEATRIEAFYAQTLEALQERVDMIMDQLDNIARDRTQSLIDPDVEEKFSQELRRSESLKRAAIDLYRDLSYLQSYCILNYTAFVKLMKKYDFLLAGKARKSFVATLAEDYTFTSFTALQSQIDRLEKGVAEHFCDGNLGVARATFLITRTGSDWNMFHVGMRFGAVLLLVVWMIWDCIVDTKLRPTEDNKWVSDILPMYRSAGCLVLLAWCWGFNIHVWSRFKINYVYMLELDPRLTMSAKRIWKAAMSTTIIFLVNFLVYFKAMRKELPPFGIPVGWLPVALWVYIIIYFTHLLLTSNRTWSKVLWNTIISPFGKVNFLATYVGDVLTSMVKVMLDLAYTGCFLYGRYWWDHSTPNPGPKAMCLDANWYKLVAQPLITGLPLWFRFMQCLRRYKDTQKRFPHLANAGKYALAQSVVMFGVFHSNFNSFNWWGSRGAYTVALVCTTLYSFTWDVTMDWGLGDRKYGFLRARLMFHKKWVYYFCILVDLLLRFAWTLTLVPAGGGPFGKDFTTYLTPMLAAAEICRRTMWSCFRLEHEHLSNVAGVPNFKRPDFVPLHFEAPQAKPDDDKDPPKNMTSIVIEVVVLAVVLIAITILAFLSHK